VSSAGEGKTPVCWPDRREEQLLKQPFWQYPPEPEKVLDCRRACTRSPLVRGKELVSLRAAGAPAAVEAHSITLRWETECDRGREVSRAIDYFHPRDIAQMLVGTWRRSSVNHDAVRRLWRVATLAPLLITPDSQL